MESIMKWLVTLLLVKTVFSADQNPDENRGINDSRLFEGDMILNQRQLDRAEHGMDVDSDRKRASIKIGRLWPKGVVVYQIHSSLARNSRAMSAIRAGMNEWTTKTCIRFKRRGREAAYVNFVNGRSCSSYLGRIGRRQDITLARGCWHRGIVAHEIGHAIGFLHEQSRPDRDNFVTIQWNNIRADRKRNFRKYSRSTIDSLGTKYDYGSLMHYGSKAFSRNGGLTITVKRSGAVIGQRRGLSTTDARQANLLYQTQCARAPPTAQSACSNYRILNETDRKNDYHTLKNAVRKCDGRSRKGWYRFIGAAGTKMPSQVVPISRCGTDATGWLDGSHPTVNQGAVRSRVCFHWAGRDRRRRKYDKPCMWSRYIRVLNCTTFFVYELIPIKRCHLRYCGAS